MNAVLPTNAPEFQPRGQPLTAGARLGRNSFFQVAAQTLGKLAALALFLALVRSLDREDVGRFTFALTYAGAFGLLTDWGASLWLTREIARCPADAIRWTHAALALRVVTFLLACAAGLALAYISAVPREVWPPLLILMLALLPDALGQTLNARLLGAERGGASAALLLCTDVLRLALVLAALRGVGLPASPLGRVAAAYCVATVLAPAAGWLIFLRKSPRAQSGARPESLLRDVRALARGALPLLGVGLLVRLYLRSDTLLLFFLRGESDVALYSAAYKLMEAWFFLPAAFLGAVFPFLARTHSPREMSAPFRAACEESVRLLALLGIPLAAGTTVLAGPLTAWLYGPTYTDSALYLQILIWAAALIFWNSTLPAALNATGHERASLGVLGAGLVFNLTGNLLLIPRWGALGAALMTLLTEMLSTTLYVFFFRKLLFRLEWLQPLRRPALASAGMMLALAALPSRFLPAQAGLSFVAQALLGAGVYVSLLILLGEFTRRDVRLWRETLGLGRRAALRGT
jgi:O-antigen/teichoic acid export membrane protein